MESFLGALERRYGRYAPGNLTYWLVGFMCASFVVELAFPGATRWLEFDAGLVVKGQVWRLVSYAILPATMSPVSALSSFYWLYQVGISLERSWGAAKFVAWWVVGIAATTATAFVFGVHADNAYLLLALFLAYATLHPNEHAMIFFVFPVELKWLALLDAIGILVAISVLPGWQRLIPVLGVANYLLFFWRELGEHAARFVYFAKRTGVRNKFVADAAPVATPVRRCVVCGITSEDESVDIRVCTCPKCKAPTEYCVAHVREHLDARDDVT